MTVLYLAHPFNSRFVMRIWELSTERLLGIEIINPFFDVVREDKEIIDEKDVMLEALATRKERYGLTDEQCATLVERDVAMIGKADGIIAIVDGSLSYGTIQEMVYAKALEKPVYAVISNGHIGHPWLRYHSTETFATLGELRGYLMGV